MGASGTRNAADDVTFVLGVVYMYATRDREARIIVRGGVLLDPMGLKEDLATTLVVASLLSRDCRSLAEYEAWETRRTGLAIPGVEMAVVAVELLPVAAGRNEQEGDT